MLTIKFAHVHDLVAPLISTNNYVTRTKTTANFMCVFLSHFTNGDSPHPTSCVHSVAIQVVAVTLNSRDATNHRASVKTNL
jgi:hypothetical protein